MTTAAPIAALWSAGLLGVGASAFAPFAAAQTPAYDRYGPPPSAGVSSEAGAVQQAPTPAPEALSRRVLTWSGKDAAPAPTLGAQVASTPASPPVVRPTAVRPTAAPVAGGTARYYSLHRAYGVAPDPAPIPPAFFGPTADFSAPETLDPVRRASATPAAAAARSAVNAARVDSEAAP